MFARVNMFKTSPGAKALPLGRFAFAQASPCFKRRFSKIFAQNIHKICKDAIKGRYWAYPGTRW